MKLDRLRAFRHRERNSYGLILDAKIVLERAIETKAAFETFRSEIAAFAAKTQDTEPGNGDRVV